MRRGDARSGRSSLVLLDLNGFKRYNDTFGHPAGDALLIRLGAALRDAVGSAGTAYRFGGDEFCLLLTCPPERFEAVTRAAVRSLSASGPGFDVSASWGAVEIPADALDPDEALRARRCPHVRAQGVAPRGSRSVRRRGGRSPRRGALARRDRITCRSTEAIRPGGRTVPDSDQRREIDLPAGRIRYREAGEGSPVVFVHGYLVDGRLWDGVVDRLSATHRCLAPDWPIGAQQIAMKPDADLTPYGIADRSRASSRRST